ncbi:prepilin peptidase [Anaerocolumna xylanovorans]|uniref:Leader peptidase (Prepilin peptidase) / N-methyltransferase n=1 Tax=Anaerocolumna xylanovorans DSM 12503 TaxID=1121345 RepID=A0A1M7YMV8_9FIRM|nr:A24 family peptidase [Anaerocolumna xylanovorans]SHO53940.1 leader peptidase (prepilin peptidase) / N-methyltransferase [Anaerocolumna xylanovorans DSM 12503]
MTLFLYIIIFVYGILIGSFLNVCIYRIPRKENIVTTRSHCMGCGYQLKWYDLVPLFSYIFLGGKCRKCKTRLSLQYPLVEFVNALLYCIIFLVNGFNPVSIIYCLMTSALLVLSIIDFRTFEIPFGINLFIGVLGLIRMGLDWTNWVNYVLGFGSVSAFLLLLFFLTKGRGIGGGDIKLMAAAGLVLGWKLNLLAFLWGCLFGSILHLIRMKVSHAERLLAFGPYLAMGIFASMLFGETFIDWYLRVCMLK